MLLSRPVLVLNATYEVINICDLRRAVLLILSEVAQCVEDNGLEIRSPYGEFTYP